jgi:hypothetical protein
MFLAALRAGNVGTITGHMENPPVGSLAASTVGQGKIGVTTDLANFREAQS